MDKIRVYIADDQRMLREGLSLLLNSQADIEVVGEAFKLDMINESMQNLKPDILLLDTALVQTREVKFITTLNKISTTAKIIMLSSQTQDECVHRALNEGARGFIVKQAPSSEVVNAIRQVMAGH